MCLKEIHHNLPWTEWPDKLARRVPSVLASAEKKYRSRIGFYLFEQYVFFRQWAELKKQAASKGIRIIGDIPIYVALDSADVWAHQDIFEIDPKSLEPLRVSGVPPDYFSETGQLWGNPLYRWNSGDPVTEEALLGWWTHRFKAMFDLVDVARVDHFRGFQAYWAVPAEEETALNGSWEPGPGPLFFEKIYKSLGELRIIAEDLGEISAEVIKLRDKLGFPGMKVLQFAFDGDPGNPFLPHNYTNPNCVVYTGTHDNDTTLGWFLSNQLNEELRATVKRFANREMHDASPIHQDLIYLALSSTASLAVLPLQDLLGFGSDCRMNIPGVAEGNWRWRCAEEFLTSELADQVKELSRRFGRC
jgi:4-alpha-glucanotransferase